MSTKLVLAVLAVVSVAAFADEARAAEGDRTYVVTWQDKGYWFARGPLQSTSGYKTEEEAAMLTIDYNTKKAGIKSLDNAPFVGSYAVGRVVYRVYSLRRTDVRGDLPTQSWLKEKGINVR